MKKEAIFISLFGIFVLGLVYISTHQTVLINSSFFNSIVSNSIKIIKAWLI